MCKIEYNNIKNLKLHISGFIQFSACIVSRAEETFDSGTGAALLKKWGVPENYIARCFVTLGYCDGKYPQPKPRKAHRSKIIE